MKKWNAVLSKSAVMMAVLSIGASAWATIDETQSLYPQSTLTVNQEIVLPQGSQGIYYQSGLPYANPEKLSKEEGCSLGVNKSVAPSEKLRIAKGTKLTLTGYTGFSNVFATFVSPKKTEIHLRCFNSNRNDVNFTEEALKKSFGDLLSVQAAPVSVIDVRMERDTDQGLKEKPQDI